MTRLLGGLAAAAASILLLAGCATTTAAPVADSPDPGAVTLAEYDAAWLDGGRLIGLVSHGSSSCVPVAEEPTYADGVLTVGLADREGAEVCTADYAPRVSLVPVPAGVDPTQDLEIVVTGEGFEGQASLPGVSGLGGGDSTDYQPSAGWTSEPGTFVLLTWGSSSCAPVVQDAAASGDAEVTVTFVDPPADQVCTMDMAPRATLVAVGSAVAGDSVEAVLTGGGFDDVRVPVVGSN